MDLKKRHIMKLTSLVLILISFFATSNAQACSRGSATGNGELSGKVYENAPTGTYVTNLTFKNNGANEYELSGNLNKYFYMDDTVMRVKNSSLLDRDEVGSPGNGQKDTQIKGKITCSADGITPISYDGEVYMFYKNKYDPIITSDDTISQTEYVEIGAELFTVMGNSGDNAGETLKYIIAEQDPKSFLEISDVGKLILLKNLNYKQNTQHMLTIRLDDEGVDSNGDVLVRNTTQQLTLNITDYDDLPPEFASCGGYSPPLYTANFITKETHTNLDIQPCHISAKDGDSGIDNAVAYQLINGTNNFDEYFEIDPDTGDVSVIKPVETPTAFLITVKAWENNTEERFSTAYLQLQAQIKDGHKPEFQKKSFSGVVKDDGNDILFATDSETGDLLLVQANDVDDPDSILLYAIDPPDSPFQISSDGHIFTSNPKLLKEKSEFSFNVRALNAEADPSSSNRESNTVTVDVEVTEGSNSVVPASTLYGVAGGLSACLLIAILIIVFLLWRNVKRKSSKEQPLVNPYPREEVEKTQSDDGSEIYQNGAFNEENEVNEKTADNDCEEMEKMATPNGEPVTDLDAPSEDQISFGVSSIYEPTIETLDTDPVSPADGEEEVYADENEAQSDDVQESVELDEELSPDPDYVDPELPTPKDAFQEELMLAAAASAARTTETQSVQEEVIDFPPRTLILPCEIIQEETTKKEDAIRSVKIVSLQRYGDEGEDVKAVLKSLHLSMATNTDIVNTKRKIAIMEQLSDMDRPNILKYYGSYEKYEVLHYANAYAENGSLHDKLESAEMDANTLMLIMAGIGTGLQYLHAKNITHGKLWSKAVMLSSDYTPMLTAMEGDHGVLENDESLRWQAVEVVDRTSRRSPATDVWSFGTLMWEIVSQGAVPYSEVSDLLELASRMQEQQLSQPRQCSKSLFSIMATCWKKDPKLRPDMYVINGKLSEKLVEDSNEHIILELRDYDSGSDDGKISSGESPPSPTTKTSAEGFSHYTAF